MQANGYAGEIVLVGINYDKESKKHSCKIEKVVMRLVRK